MSRSPSAPAPGGAPSARRRVLACVSLLSMAVLAVVVVIFLVRNPLLLVGGLVGVVTAVAGAWWLITERDVRRWVGAGVLVLGLVILVTTLFAVTSDRQGGLWRAAVAVALLALGVGAGRAALAPDLRDFDPARLPHVRPRHAVLICNPKSGGGKVESFGLVALAQELGVEVVMLEPGLDLAQLANDAVDRGADCLGMAGGDGSQALVASIASRRGVPFVCVSAGTRNHFALDLGLDRDDPRKGLVALHDGVERRIDYATVGDRLFVNNVSFGVYATIVQEDAYRDAKVETSSELLPAMLGRQSEPFDLQFTTPDGREVDGAFVVLVSNNPYVLGPSLDLSQRRAMDTGRLGVVAVTARSGGEAGRMVARAALGLGWRDPHLIQFETESLEVRSRGGRAFAGVDGESLDLPTPLRLESHPGGLRLLVPEEDVLAAGKRRARTVNVGALTDLARGRAVPAGA